MIKYKKNSNFDSYATETHLKLVKLVNNLFCKKKKKVFNILALIINYFISYDIYRILLRFANFQLTVYVV